MPGVEQDGPKQRWLGYTCPDCRMIFRIEAGSQGRRAQCPGCHALMVLGGGSGSLAAAPEAEPETLYAKAVIEKPDEAPVSYLQEGGSMRRRVAILGPAEADQDELTWESSSGRREFGNMALTVMLMVMFLFVGGIGYMVYSIVRSDFEAERTVLPEEDRKIAVESAVGELLKGEPEPTVIELELQAELPRIREAVQEFLAAETVDEMLGIVRDRERLEPLIRGYYDRRGFRQESVRDIAKDGKVQVIESLFSVLLEFRDYSERAIALERSGDRYLVDWESWVGYSEMPWADFLKNRPSEPKSFRVRCSPVEYYNFAFIDDKKWQSFRLESPDEEFLIFGYAERFSRIANELTARDGSRADAAMMVKVRYPKNPRTANQVIISEFVTTGWVLIEDEE